VLAILFRRARKHLARWIVQPRPPCPWCPGEDHEARDHFPLHDDG
jgi:hypothetical protein